MVFWYVFNFFLSRGGGMVSLVLEEKKNTSTKQHHDTRPPPTLRTHVDNNPSMLKLPKSPANIPIPLYLQYFQVPIYCQFELIYCFCSHYLYREAMPCINHSPSESPLNYYRLNSPLLYSQAMSAGPITTDC